VAARGARKTAVAPSPAVAMARCGAHVAPISGIYANPTILYTNTLGRQSECGWVITKLGDGYMEATAFERHRQFPQGIGITPDYASLLEYRFPFHQRARCGQLEPLPAGDRDQSPARSKRNSISAERLRQFRDTKKGGRARPFPGSNHKIDPIPRRPIHGSRPASRNATWTGDSTPRAGGHRPGLCGGAMPTRPRTTSQNGDLDKAIGTFAEGAQNQARQPRGAPLYWGSALAEQEKGKTADKCAWASARGEQCRKKGRVIGAKHHSRELLPRG